MVCFIQVLMLLPCTWKDAKDWVLRECNGLSDYLEKSEERMLKEIVKENLMMEKEGKEE